MSRDRDAGFEIDEKRFRRFSQRDDIYCRSFWDPGVHSEKSRIFYETLLGVPPTKQRPGYVKFEPDDPSVNLTLNEVGNSTTGGQPATHYGIQVKSTQAVQDAIQRLSAAGLRTDSEENTACCYAVQDKVWLTDPDGNKWEVFVVLEADVDQRKDETSSCCAGDTDAGCC